MSDVAYMVVFRGELVDGAELEQVKDSLQNLCKLTAEKVEQLFNLPAVVLKKNLSHELAQGFKHQLERIGVITEVKAMEDAKVVAVSDSTLAAAAPQSGDEAVAAIRAENADQGERLQVEFHGKGDEYFKIWIVNIFLTILTLGIYSAWAKVRNHRYFYSNTQIGEGSFEYTADPVSILKGRIIAVIFLIAFNYSATAMPTLYLILLAVLMIALPWLINRSMAFRCHNTVYRNVRFSFGGSYVGALMAFIIWPLLGMLTAGILLPYAIFKQNQYLVENAHYGTTPFSPEFVARDVYGIAIRAFLLLLAAGALVGLGSLMGPLIALAVIAAMVLYFFGFCYFTANIGNLIYNKAKLSGHGFDSTLETKGLAFIYFTNWILLSFTLGLAAPWAKVRLAEYRAQHLAVLANGSLDTFIAAEEKQVNSLGEEIGEAFDIDIGL